MEPVAGLDGWVATEAVRSGKVPPQFLLLQDFPSLQRYRSWRFLGGGAFGRVYAGFHSGLGRVEAVKRIEITDAKVRHLSLEETRVMASLPPHPHLVSLYNVEEGDDSIYLTMQFVDGKPLDDTPLPVTVAQALACTRDVCEALALVHAHNIVHRDIKPGNVFVTLLGKALLGDFGVARATDDRNDVAAIAGTPAYMPPEAWEGQVTPASDLWSVGVMLYELLTGTRPFITLEDLPFSRQRADKLRAATFECPSVVRPGIPGRIDDLVLMLLARRPEDRPASAMAVLDHLPRYKTVVSAVEGDLTRMAVDAVVVSANEAMAMNVPGSIGNAILNAGGQSILDEARAATPNGARVGTCVITRGGTLPARHVLHAVMLGVDPRGYLQPLNERDVRRALWACLRKAHELRLKSIALPALGLRIGGITPDDAARMIVDVTHTYLLEFRPPLERVTFVLHDKMVALAFREAAIDRGMVLV